MLIAAVIAAATLASHAVGQAGSTGIQMRAVRFWLPDAKKTSVLAMVEVPYSLATPIGTGSSAYIAYNVRVLIKDSNGGVLNQLNFPHTAPAELRSENASGVEQVNFGVPAGSYWLAVEVLDSATKRVTSDSIRLNGYANSPGASDLLLANRMRTAASGDTAVDAGEIARGNFRFVTSPVLHVDMTSPVMGFMMEAYSPDSTTAGLTVKIASADGTDLVTLLPTEKVIPAGGGVFANQFSVDGLPPGQYLLKAILTIKGKAQERQAPFTVNAMESSYARNVAETSANSGRDDVYFNAMPEDSLDAAAEELQILPDVTTRELQEYKKDELSLAAKRHYLIEFWAKRDPNKSTPENEARIRFYNAIGYANAHFSVRYVPGWKTARGRIFARYGAPDDSLRSTMGGRGIPYLVWSMTSGKRRWFIFGDRANNGNYVLLRSSEPTGEPGTPGWVEQVTGESARDIATWLGLPVNTFLNGG